MKKTFLTAIAIFAFGFGSYANNINIDIIEQEEEKIEISIKDKIENETSLKAHIFPVFSQEFITNLINCGSVYQDMVAANTPIFGEEAANTIALGTWMGCMGFDPVNGW